MLGKVGAFLLFISFAPTGCDGLLVHPGRAQRRAELHDRLSSEEDRYEADERFERVAKTQMAEKEKEWAKQHPKEEKPAPGSTLKEFVTEGEDFLTKLRESKKQAKKESSGENEEESGTVKNWDAAQLMDDMKNIKVQERKRHAPSKIKAELEARVEREEAEVKRMKYRMAPIPLKTARENLRKRASSKDVAFVAESEDSVPWMSKIHDEVIARHPERKPHVPKPEAKPAPTPMKSSPKNRTLAPVGSVVKAFAGNRTKHHGLRGHRAREVSESMTSIPVMMPGDATCHERLSAKTVGMKLGVARSFASFEAEMEKKKKKKKKDAVIVAGLPESWAHPGSGAAQTMKGPDASGTIDGEDPYLTVYKDGYMFTGCLGDNMWQYSDKYGENKDQYGAQFANVSVVWYHEVMEQHSMVPIEPRICFEFCRTVPNMLFFGLVHGRKCYCTPYYTQNADGGACDMPCEGNAAQTCGGDKQSSIYEMHMCGDAARDLAKTRTQARDRMDFFGYAAHDIYQMADQLQNTGKVLENIATKGGDALGSELGLAAAKYAGRALDTVRGCFDTYAAVLGASKKTDDLGDLYSSKNLLISEEAQRAMGENGAALEACTDGATAAVRAGNPVFYDKQEALEQREDGDLAALMALQEKSLAASAEYVGIMYAVDKSKLGKQATCQGDAIREPMVGLTQPECALACSSTDFPVKCVGFQYVEVQRESLESKDKFAPLCFLFSNFLKISSWNCAQDDLAARGTYTERQEFCREGYCDEGNYEKLPSYWTEKAMEEGNQNCPDWCGKEQSQKWVKFSGHPALDKAAQVVKDEVAAGEAIINGKKKITGGLCFHVKRQLDWRSPVMSGVSAVSLLGSQEWADFYADLCGIEYSDAAPMFAAQCYGSFAAVNGLNVGDLSEYTENKRCFGGDHNEQVSAAPYDVQLPDYAATVELGDGQEVVGVDF